MKNKNQPNTENPVQGNPLDRLYRRDEVLRQFAPVSTSTIYAWIAAGHFPAPIQIGARAVAWRQADLIAWQSKKRDGESH